jgi:hypothetical protein
LIAFKKLKDIVTLVFPIFDKQFGCCSSVFVVHDELVVEGDRRKRQLQTKLRKPKERRMILTFFEVSITSSNAMMIGAFR